MGKIKKYGEFLKESVDYFTVGGRIARLNDFFNQPGNSGDYSQMRRIYDHFKAGGTPDELEPELKGVWKRNYGPGSWGNPDFKGFTEDEFIEIFEGLDQTKRENE